MERKSSELQSLALQQLVVRKMVEESGQESGWSIQRRIKRKCEEDLSRRMEPVGQVR